MLEPNVVKAEVDEVHLQFTQTALKNRRRGKRRVLVGGCAVATWGRRVPSLDDGVVRCSSSVEQLLERAGREVLDGLVAFDLSTWVHQGALTGSQCTCDFDEALSVQGDVCDDVTARPGGQEARLTELFDGHAADDLHVRVARGLNSGKHNEKNRKLPPEEAG
jgi:hypothetical protein